MSEDTKRPQIQSISRAIAILQCIGKNRELGLTEISRLVGLHKSTTAGIIHTLKAERFLEQDEQTEKLRLGSALFLLTMNAWLGLEDICEPYLSTLLNETGETVNMAIRDGNEVVYIAKKESPHSMRISTSVGRRMPLYCTAMGKAILAHTDAKTANRIISELDFKAFTSKTITDKDQFLQVLNVIRDEGVAYDFEELEYGLTCVAAPVFQRADEPVGAISVSGPTVRMNDDTLKTVSRQILEIVKDINKDLSRSGRQLNFRQKTESIY